MPKAAQEDGGEIAQVSVALMAASDSAMDALQSILTSGLSLRNSAAVSVPYLMMLGTLTGGWMALRSAQSAKSENA